MGESDGEKPGSNIDERERRILEAAGKLIAHYGYDKTTVADIAKEAGISKGAIYLHFESKEKLFDALILYESNRVLEDMVARIQADPQGGTFVSLYSHGLTALAANPLMKALTTRNKRVLGDYLRRLSGIGMVGQSVGIAKEFVTAFQQAGLLRDDLTTEEIIYFLSMVRYGLLLVDDFLPPEAILPLDSFGPTFVTLLERAIASPEGGDTQKGKAIIAHWVKLVQTMLANNETLRE
jgi:AcrR family transcriptional regulator